MKIRNGFISNSSSTSFVIRTKPIPENDNVEPKPFETKELIGCVIPKRIILDSSTSIRDRGDLHQVNEEAYSWWLENEIEEFAEHHSAYNICRCIYECYYDYAEELPFPGEAWIRALAVENTDDFFIYLDKLNLKDYAPEYLCKLKDEEVFTLGMKDLFPKIDFTIVKATQINEYFVRL